MRRSALALVVTAATLAVPAAAAAQADTITATGSDSVKVVPKDRKSNASIVAAVEAAQVAGISGAISQAKEYAQDYAAAVGLTLGAVQSVTDVQNNNGYGVAYAAGTSFGPFGPNQYCGTVRRPVFRRVGKRVKLVKTIKQHRCFVPSFETTTLTVTYSAS